MPDSSIDFVLQNDPKHIGFTLARYKFVAKIFAGYPKVLEIGCGNGIGGAVVRQHVGHLDQTDETTHDIVNGAWEGYDGVFCLDVIEHIEKDDTDVALFNLSACAPVCIIGTPSLESQVYATALSKEKHVNCMSGETLRAACLGHWNHVFMFTMQDEVLGTSYFPMAHYLIALCVE